MKGARPRLVRIETELDCITAESVPEDLVTVAVSLYNYGRFLPECLESVLAQRHPHLELVVVDDASETDDSVAVARAWLSEHAQSFARVQLLRHARNQGLAEARNTAFAAARSEFVFVLDADNMIYPRAISRLYEVMRHREFAAAYTQLEFFGSERRLGFADVFEKDRLIPGNYIDAMALVSKRTWESVGGYTHMEGWEDYDFWCKVVDCGLAAAYVPEILCRYRVHPASMLRNDTVKSLQQIVVELTMRHPWISIG